MSGPSRGNPEPVTDTRQLVEYLEGGCKPKENWRIGTEHEKFVFEIDTLRPAPYEGSRGIRAFLEGLMRVGWDGVYDHDHLIGLTRDGCNISLEPGGQLELSGEPLLTIHQSCDEVNQHLREVKAVADALDLGMLGLGFNPKWPREDHPWMPKSRYAIMRRYMPEVGTMGHDMMLRTCGAQVNLDFDSERDMVRKFRVGLALQPVVTALFAYSPFIEGRDSGYLSYRSHVWTDTDNDRCGMLPFVFEPGMGFERYTEYALNVPMYFVYRDGEYIDVAGQSFRDFMAGELPGLPGERPTIGDWEDHLTTLFPEVRLKRFLEMRGADSGPWGRLCALPAFWTGLLYDSDALEAAEELTADWTVGDIVGLREAVPRTALNTPFHGKTLQHWASRSVEIAAEGLRRRARVGKSGRDEVAFLDTLREIAATGMAPAQELLCRYRSRWGGSVDPVFTEYAY